MNECRIINVSNDDLVSIILSEVIREVEENQENQLQVINTDSQSMENKGLCICDILLAVAEGIASSVIYDLLKAVIKRFRNTKEYSPSAVIEIEYTNGQECIKVKLTLNDILEK